MPKDRKFISPDVMPPQLKAGFLNLEINGQKVRLDNKDIKAIEEMRIGLAVTHPSGVLIRAPFSSILAALVRCEGKLDVLKEMGALAKTALETAEKPSKPGNILLAITNAQMAKRKRKPSKQW